MQFTIGISHRQCFTPKKPTINIHNTLSAGNNDGY
jgi:hypothetical protein